MSFDVELGQRTARLSETVHLSLDSLWFSSSLLSSVQFHFQTWKACSIIQDWKNCLGMSRFSCYNSLLLWEWQVRISYQSIWLIYSPLYRNYSSSSMAWISESLEQRRIAVAQGLNRLVHLIGMLLKENFKRLLLCLPENRFIFYATEGELQTLFLENR